MTLKVMGMGTRVEGGGRRVEGGGEGVREQVVWMTLEADRTSYW